MKNTSVLLRQTSLNKRYYRLYSLRYLRLFLLLMPSYFSSTLALSSTCDTQLLKRADSGANGYRDRSGICEGLYESPVSADFELVSMLNAPLIEHFSKDDVIQIMQPNLTQQMSTSSISIRGLALKPRLYYRMDTTFDASATISWPVNEVLSTIKLDAQELGIYGWQETNKGMVYIPVDAKIANSPAKTAAAFDTQVIVRAGVPIKKIAWRLLGEGVSDKYVNESKSYAVGAPIPILITWPSTLPQIIKLEVAAKPMTSNEWIIQIFNIALPRPAL
ncbi:hypothetical protein Patl_2440 [Paraglaciecola sp. T6c]|uniref:hypothetical protein n=1 Tax=Pseudoalteromonas atlantica (strain T6c / ATCC BAA-1087) TaxID=3042615 RepID=UPI00005C5289|nr:hypothetical protein [Paraglaciecola sp. T6c]ABG40956.1 hypothetical protein Patl_2440 [Paraglaciecola sp. T6c]